MKKFIIIIVGLMVSTMMFSQTTTKIVGKTIKVERTVSTSNDEKTPFNFETKIEGKDTILPVFITKNNACYVMRVSKKTGNPYKQYMPKEISLQIAKEMGRKVENIPTK